MSDLSVTIPSAVVWVILVTFVWWGVGYVVNSTLVTWHQDRWLRAHKTSVVPERYFRVRYLLAGPVGWAAWLFDL